LVNLQGDVEVTVVLDRVPAGIQDGGLPVAEGLVPFLVVIGQAGVAGAGIVQGVGGDIGQTNLQ